MICPSDKLPASPHPTHSNDTAPRGSAADDSADVDGAASSTSPPVRSDVVRRVKRQLQLGMYDEDAKLDAVLDRLMADVMAHDEAPASTANSEAAPDPRQPNNADRNARNR